MHKPQKRKDAKKEDNFLGVLFCELLSHLPVMVLDVQYNALSARVSFNVGYSIISEGVAQVQHSEGLGSPCSDPCVRVGRALVYL